MTPEEAIYELEDLKAGDIEVGRARAARAEGLGIEALKRCRSNYLDPQHADFRRLPGETEH